MAPIMHRHIQTNGIQLYIAEAGPADGPCVIMCHGFPESWYSWRHQLHALGDEATMLSRPICAASVDHPDRSTRRNIRSPSL